jgi:hypothetical protein
MARLRSTAQHWRYDPTDDVERLDIYLDLLMGPHGGFTEEQLRIAWDVERDSIMEHNRNNSATIANRPWGYWKFELGEEPPEHDEKLHLPWPEAIRLAELGELRPDEIAALAEKAAEAKARIAKGWHHEHISALGTDCERWYDRETARGWELLQKALKR